MEKTRSVGWMMAAWMPSFAANSRANRFAPWWPPRSGIMALPFSDNARTGGSLCLSEIKGARALIRMPAAQTPMIGLSAMNRFLRCTTVSSKVSSASFVRLFRPCTVAPERVLASLLATSYPLGVRAMKTGAVMDLAHQLGGGSGSLKNKAP